MKKTLLSLSIIVATAVIFSACQSSQPTTTAPSTAPAAAVASTAPAAEPSAMPAIETSPAMPAAPGARELNTETTYQSPAGPEKVAFALTVDAQGVITDATTTVLAKAPISVVRQEAFAKEMPTVLKGKKLAELTKVDRIGGSSLTTGAFNAALTQLKAGL
ncbi:MAG TPA: hypothetical protein VD999_03545 [Vitreimonas sp.]|nr:hypothetical protein [Vitreimonas sp.]